jgi:hypothetical protein
MTTNRKAATAAYKERKTVAGIYAVRCLPTGQVWVGSAPNLETIPNRIWFSLRHGNSSWRTLQPVWNEHQPEEFAFEELERLGDDVSEFRRKDLLKERAAHWLQELNALPM